MDCLDCLICLYPINKEFKIIKHSKCRYQLHIDCADKYDKCLYCHKVIITPDINIDIFDQLHINLYRLYYNLTNYNNFYNYEYIIILNYFEYDIFFIMIFYSICIIRLLNIQKVIKIFNNFYRIINIS